MNKFFPSMLPEYSLALLKEIMTSIHFQDFYLSGGTALALQLGHRRSDDLDLFTRVDFKTNILKSFPEEYEVVNMHDNSIEIISKETKVFLFYFGFPLKNGLLDTNEIRLADPVDIGMMKLLALQGRSSKKDIIDLYYIHKEVIPLGELLDTFEKFYPLDKFNSLESLRTIINKNELETQPDPVMISNYKWEDQFNEVVEEITKYVRNKLIESK